MSTGLIDQAMSYLAEHAPLINTEDNREASMIVTSHNGVGSIQIRPKTITSATPAIEVDVNTSGTIILYVDTGSGYQYKRSV